MSSPVKCLDSVGSRRFSYFLFFSREDDSDSDDDSSDDDVPLRTLIRSKPSLAGSMVSAVTSET